MNIYAYYDRLIMESRERGGPDRIDGFKIIWHKRNWFTGKGTEGVILRRSEVYKFFKVRRGKIDWDYRVATADNSDYKRYPMDYPANKIPKKFLHRTDPIILGNMRPTYARYHKFIYDIVRFLDYPS